MTPAPASSLAAARDALLAPARLHTRAEVLSRPSPVPLLPGIYAWYFDEIPPQVPLDGVHEVDGHRLLYVGIAPRRPPLDRPPGRRTLRARLREHCKLNAEGSTLRLTLGCLLGLELRRIESRTRPGMATRRTFGRDGEDELNRWLEAHARVVWHPCEQAWSHEAALLRDLAVPFNLHGHAHGAFHARLAAIRAEARARARELPPLKV